MIRPHLDPAILDQAFEFMGVLDLEGRLVTANRTALAFIDQPLESVVGQFFWETPWWEHDPHAQAMLQHAVQEAREGRFFRKEVTHRTLGGEERVVDFSMSPIRDEAGAVVWLLPEGRDVTTFAAQRAAMAQEEAKFRLLFLRSKDGMLLLDGDRFIDCNPAVLEMMRCTEPEFLRMHPWELSPATQPDGRDSHEKAMAMIRLAHQRGGHRFEWIHRRADGEDFPVEVTLIPIPLMGRQVLYTTWRDISNRKVAEDSLRASEARFRMVAELTGQAIYDRNLDSGQIIWTGATESLTGDPPSAFETGGPSAWLSRIHGDDLAVVLATIQPVEESGGSFELEYRFQHRDGSFRVFADRGTVLLNGAHRRSLGAISDVTHLRQSEHERLELERRMLHTQKLESLGLLAGGIAHDFNNLLTAILGHLNLAQDRAEAGSEVSQHFEGMTKAIQKAARLTRQMLAYSGKGRFQVELHDLNLMVTEIQTLLGASLPKKVQIALELEPDLPPIEADGAQIQQVVLNLVTNAADAIGDEEGRIQIRTLRAELDAGTLQHLFADWPLRPGLHVGLEVADTGCGMKPEVMARIFDPFFTTKDTGRGLGLSAIQGILKSHAAGLRIYSEPGRGTTFRVYFRASEGQLPEPLRELSEKAEALQGLVLVADDEESILETSRLALKSLGLEVILARDGQEALDQVMAHHDRLKLVLLDLTMPRKDGKEVFEEIRRMDAHLPVILCSGFSLRDAPGADQFGTVDFLQKPYTIKELRAATRKALRIPPTQ